MAGRHAAVPSVGCRVVGSSDDPADETEEVAAWQLAEAMREKKLSKARMATLLKSRTQVDRLLDPGNDITLSGLQRAAAMVGRRVTIQLV